MNWKDIYAEATPAERESIMFLLKERIQMSRQNVGGRPTIKKRIRSLLSYVRKSSPRASFHWIGYHRRSLRIERHLYVLLFASALVLLEPREYVLWSISLGSATSLFLMLVTVYRLIPRKRAHWVQ